MACFEAESRTTLEVLLKAFAAHIKSCDYHLFIPKLFQLVLWLETACIKQIFAKEAHFGTSHLV